jgi:hypothetical protein
MAREGHAPIGHEALSFVSRGLANAISDIFGFRRRIAYGPKMGSQFGHVVGFRCPHCGAGYVVSYIKLPIADSDSDYCECCKRRMLQWNSALQPRYRLVERPERNTHNASSTISGAPRTQLPTVVLRSVYF